MKQITEFKNEYAFLSNFYPCKIVCDGIEFKCSESLYMAHKSGNTDDFIRFSQLDAREAKKIGKTVVLQKNWDAVKFEVMRKVLQLKFDQNPDLKQKLIETGDAELIESNWWKDTVWGVCDGVGENNLGKLLMELRGTYK